MEALEAAGMRGARLARERALAVNVAPWVIDFERRRREGARLVVEQRGKIEVAPGFHLTAKADRIEVRAWAADVLDFKTRRGAVEEAGGRGLRAPADFYARRHLCATAVSRSSARSARPRSMSWSMCA